MFSLQVEILRYDDNTVSVDDIYHACVFWVLGLASMSKLSAVDASSASTLENALLPFMCPALAVGLYLQASPFECRVSIFLL